MKKLRYYIARIFFSKKKIVLIKLLNTIQDDTRIDKDGVQVMKKHGISNYIVPSNFNAGERVLLNSILISNKAIVQPYDYEQVFEYLKELIKKH